VIARDSLVIASPRINAPIVDRAVITGNFDEVTAQLMTAQLMSERLPFSLVVVEQK
jgi:preprotein translocase subunit SecD